MIGPVVAYFGGERAAGLVLIGIAAVAIEVAVTVWRKSGTVQANSAAVVLALVAAIQLIVGGVVFVRAPQQQAEVVRAVQEGDRPRILSQEIPRLKQVVERFAVYRWIEIGLLVFAVAAVLFARSGSRWRGVGAGLAPQAALMLLFDHLAEQRAQAYLTWLLGL